MSNVHSTRKGFTRARQRSTPAIREKMRAYREWLAESIEDEELSSSREEWGDGRRYHSQEALIDEPY